MLKIKNKIKATSAFCFFAMLFSVNYVFGVDSLKPFTKEKKGFFQVLEIKPLNYYGSGFDWKDYRSLSGRKTDGIIEYIEGIDGDEKNNKADPVYSLISWINDKNGFSEIKESSKEVGVKGAIEKGRRLNEFSGKIKFLKDLKYTFSDAIDKLKKAKIEGSNEKIANTLIGDVEVEGSLLKVIEDKISEFEKAMDGISFTEIKKLPSTGKILRKASQAKDYLYDKRSEVTKYLAMLMLLGGGAYLGSKIGNRPGAGKFTKWMANRPGNFIDSGIARIGRFGKKIGWKGFGQKGNRNYNPFSWRGLKNN